MLPLLGLFTSLPHPSCAFKTFISMKPLSPDLKLSPALLPFCSPKPFIFCFLLFLCPLPSHHSRDFSPFFMSVCLMLSDVPIFSYQVSCIISPNPIIPDSAILGNSLRRIGVNSSLNVWQNSLVKPSAPELSFFGSLFK